MDRELKNKVSYEESIEDRPIPEKKRKELEPLFFDFFNQFKDNLSEYVRESVNELAISEVLVEKNMQIFSGVARGKARIKNQGDVSCFISTKKEELGYRLDPGEMIEMYVNNEVYVTTLSGTTNLGFIKY